MESFDAYGSDSDEGAASVTGGDDATNAPNLARAAAAPAPAWQQDGNESESEGEGEQNGAAGLAANVVEYAEAAVSKEAEPKKRKLLNPFAALQQGKPSFLAAGAPKDEPEFFSAKHDAGGDAKPAQQDRETKDCPAGGAAGSALASVLVLPPAQRAGAAASQAKKEETTRQKNSRKQKLGQANFTVKSNRECPDIWQGGS